MTSEFNYNGSNCDEVEATDDEVRAIEKDRREQKLDEMRRQSCSFYRKTPAEQREQDRLEQFLEIANRNCSAIMLGNSVIYTGVRYDLAKVALTALSNGKLAIRTVESIDGLKTCTVVYKTSGVNDNYLG